MFKKGDIVWAKVRGYSWWPARIGEVLKEKNEKEKKYRVDFIGDNTYTSLPQDKVNDFVEGFSRFSKTKKKDLLEAIDMARKQVKKEDIVILDKRHAVKKSGEKGGNGDNKDVLQKGDGT